MSDLLGLPCNASSLGHLRHGDEALLNHYSNPTFCEECEMLLNPLDAWMIRPPDRPVLLWICPACWYSLYQPFGSAASS